VPTQHKGLRGKFPAGIKNLSITNVGQTGPARIRKGGVTYDIWLVGILDTWASPKRIETPTGVKAYRYLTSYQDVPHIDWLDYTDVPHQDWGDYMDTGVHKDWYDYNDKPHGDWSDAHTDWFDYNDFGLHGDHMDGTYYDTGPHGDHSDYSDSGGPHQDSHTDWGDYDDIGPPEHQDYWIYSDVTHEDWPDHSDEHGDGEIYDDTP